MKTTVGTAHRHKTAAGLWSDKTDVVSGSTHTHEYTAIPGPAGPAGATGPQGPAGSGSSGPFNIRDYGAVGNGTADDTAAIQAAIDACSAVGGGEVNCPAGNYKCNVILKSGVVLRGANEHQGYIPGGIYPTAFTKAADGYVIDTPSAGANAAGVIGINVSGGGAGLSGGGIRLRGSWWSSIKNVNVDRCKDEGIVLGDGCVACTLEDVLATNCVLNRTRNAVIGAVDVSGTDHYLSRIESTISGTLEGRVQSSNLYCVGIAVRMTNGCASGLVGEVSDVGIYAGGSMNKYVNCRGDLNYGHGIQVVSSASTYVGCEAINNSVGSPGVYDGFLVTQVANTISACRAVGAHKYGLEDTVANADASQRSTIIGFVSSGHVTAPMVNAADQFSGVVIAPAVVKIANGTVEPDVGQTTLVALYYSTPTTVTGFRNGVNGQTIRVFGTANVTLQYGAPGIVTNTGANKVMPASGLPLVFTKYGAYWLEDA